MMRKCGRLVCIAFCGAVGCVNVDLGPVPHEPIVKCGTLVEPVDAFVPHKYESASASRTLAVPVSFEMRDADAVFCVTSENMLGYSTTSGTFGGGAIVGREFRHAVASNFRIAQGEEAPVAKFCVSVVGISVKMPAWSNVAEASLRIRVDVTKSGGNESAFSRTIAAAAKGKCLSEKESPSAFYDALGSAVRDFLTSWDSSGAASTLLRWNDSAKPGLVPPELGTLEWIKEGDVWLGRCEVKCNGYEGFQAKAWANSQIAVACRTKLGNIETERVRIIYDDDEFDGAARKWTFVFRTFGRSKMVLSFNKLTRRGQIIGDLGLMDGAGRDVDKAVEELKKYVLSQMGSFVGAVSVDSQKGEAMVRFDDISTDATYNLVTIRFRLVY